MTVRRLAEQQPDDFAFAPAAMRMVEREIAKYPPGRQHSAVIGVLWLAQVQHSGWLPEPAIRHVADLLGMPFIRALEVATFYTMFNLSPVGRKAHIQVCGTTPCMLRGAEDLKQICRERINHEQDHLSADGDFSWIEVECAGACVNAPMVQIGSDTFEDLTPETFNRLIDDIAAGKPVAPGPQTDRQFSEPEGGATTLTEADLFVQAAPAPEPPQPEPATVAPETTTVAPVPEPAGEAGKPSALSAPRGGAADDLKRISGIGAKIEQTLNELGTYHFDQIAAWTDDNVLWVDDHLRFSGRIEREGWIAQAKAIVAGAPDKRS